MLELGIPIAGGSDAPVESCNPLIGLYMAITRQDLKAYPAGGWLPEQKLSSLQSLQLFTTGSAYAEFAEKEKGALAPGMLADFVVVDRNLLQIEPEQILETKILATYVGGRLVYQGE